MKPTYLLEAWQVEGSNMLNFSIIENIGFSECKEHFEYHKMVNGKSATVFVFFNDYDIRDNQIVVTASKFMKGEYTRIDVDLNKCIATKTKGLDRTNPR